MHEGTAGGRRRLRRSGGHLPCELRVRSSGHSAQGAGEGAHDAHHPRSLILLKRLCNSPPPRTSCGSTCHQNQQAAGKKLLAACRSDPCNQARRRGPRICNCQFVTIPPLSFLRFACISSSMAMVCMLWGAPKRHWCGAAARLEEGLHCTQDGGIRLHAVSGLHLRQAPRVRRYALAPRLRQALASLGWIPPRVALPRLRKHALHPGISTCCRHGHLIMLGSKRTMPHRRNRLEIIFGSARASAACAGRVDVALTS